MVELQLLFVLQPFRSILTNKVGRAHAVRKLGYRQAVGVKAAVAIVLERRLQKTKSITTSNWALPRLRPNQLLYAANDAHAAIAIFHAMGMPYTPVEAVAPGSPHVERRISAIS